MDVLVCLASKPGEIVSADELLETVWHGRPHVDNTVYQVVTHLRHGLGDDVHRPRYIETIRKRGYRLICPVAPAVSDAEFPDATSDAAPARPHGRRHLALAATVALLAVAFLLTVQTYGPKQQVSEGGVPADRSVAVMPFIDLSADPLQQFFGDGITEELIHMLSKLPDLRVIARTSSFVFRDSDKDVQQIADELDVATILEGSVRTDGNRFRITARLVDARHGSPLWSQVFDGRSSDIFTIQRQIASAVATVFDYQELDALAAIDSTEQTEELQTYESYLLGLHHLRKRSISGYSRAAEFFEHAIESDPGYVRAYAGLSESYAGLSMDGADLEMLGKAESAADYALLLDGQSAESHFAIGYVAFLKKDFSSAEAEFLRVIEINPNDARPYVNLALIYNEQHKIDAAFQITEKALALHPMSPRLTLLMGSIYRRRNDWNSALRLYKRAIELDPEYARAYSNVADYYWRTGQYEEAVPYLKKLAELPGNPKTIGSAGYILGRIYRDIGALDLAEKIVHQMRENNPDDFSITNLDIHLQLARGNLSEARRLVHRSVSTHLGHEVITSFLAFYEMIIGDTEHAGNIYAFLAENPSKGDAFGDSNLFRKNDLSWGMLGAVNLAYLQWRDGNQPAAQALLKKSREFAESSSQKPELASGSLYVLAQISAIEGNREAAIEYAQRAVDAGWTKAWFARIDPIMVDLREAPRFQQILAEVDDRLLQLRERSKTLRAVLP
jgi:TolB-like protein/Flp pilus assembly protein TadD